MRVRPPILVCRWRVELAALGAPGQVELAVLEWAAQQPAGEAERAEAEWAEAGQAVRPVP